MVNAPQRGLDSMVTLATNVQSQRGVYALLLGSGVSTGAGIPTGWGIVKSLVAQIAAAKAPDDVNAGAIAAAAPEEWWSENGDGHPLGYSALLELMASTPAARRGFIAPFFTPTQDESEQGLKVPSPAHRAIARMVAQGYIKVILTTNFDRLLERALEDVDMPPQVVATPDALRGMTPLPHAPITVIKVNGDVADLEMRNTELELSEYPEYFTALLERVLDEYGLIISGWSAEWDKALVRAMVGTRSRRYPLFWDSRSSGNDSAAALLANHRGVVVHSASADELFTGLEDRLAALEKLVEPPLTTDVAVQRLKRYVLDPLRRIDLRDLVSDTVERAARGIRESPTSLPDNETLDELMEHHRLTADPAVRLLTTGVFFDTDGSHDQLWVDSLQRLVAARTPPSSYQEAVEPLRHYPALIALRAMGIAAIYRHNDRLLLRLLSEPIWRRHLGTQEKSPAAHALHPNMVLDRELLLQMTRFGGSRFYYPASIMLREDLAHILEPLVGEGADYVELGHRFEYRLALAEQLIEGGAWNAASGEFMGERYTNRVPELEAETRREAIQEGDAWPWWPLIRGREKLDEQLANLAKYFEILRQQN